MPDSTVLIVSSEPLGAQMAGPAIRAYELARALADDFRVSIAAPAPSQVDDPRITVVHAGFIDYAPLLEAVQAADVVVAQQLPPRLLSKLPGLGTRFIADLYNPTVMEVLEGVRDRPPASRRRLQSVVDHAAVAHCAAADHIICASEKQRDLWLGLMAGHGLLDIADYERDRTMRSLIDVVPFGMPAQPPQRTGPAIRGVWPGIAPEDRIVLWGGGIWNWLDAITVIDAVALLEGRRAATDPRTHLCFMGVGRPAVEARDVMSAGAEAIAHARSIGVEGTVVHFNHGWVPYADRGGYLLEADLGVCAHHDHLEARFSFRTRVLDYLWARLPVVTTRGDTLADLVETSGIGRTVAPEDPAAFADALVSLLDDPDARAGAIGRIDALAPSFHWEEAVRPLRAFCAGSGDPPRTRHQAVLRRETIAQYPSLLAETHGRLGVRGAAAQLARNLRRAMTPKR